MSVSDIINAGNDTSKDEWDAYVKGVADQVPPKGVLDTYEVKWQTVLHTADLVKCGDASVDDLHTVTAAWVNTLGSNSEYMPPDFQDTFVFDPLSATENTPQKESYCKPVKRDPPPAQPTTNTPKKESYCKPVKRDPPDFQDAFVFDPPPAQPTTNTPKKELYCKPVKREKAPKKSSSQCVVM